MSEQAQEQKQISGDFPITFTLEEVQNVINMLAEVPAKYSMGIIAFMKGRAEQQIQDAGVTEDKPQE